MDTVEVHQGTTGPIRSRPTHSNPPPPSECFNLCPLWCTLFFYYRLWFNGLGQHGRFRVPVQPDSAANLVQSQSSESPPLTHIDGNLVFLLSVSVLPSLPASAIMGRVVFKSRSLSMQTTLSPLDQAYTHTKALQRQHNDAAGKFGGVSGSISDGNNSVWEAETHRRTRQRRDCLRLNCTETRCLYTNQRGLSKYRRGSLS